MSRTETAMVKESASRRASRQAADDTPRVAFDRGHAVAVDPPDYGIDFLDTILTPLARERRRQPVAAILARTDVRFRLPTFDALEAVYTDKTLAIPKDVVQNRVARLLGRMKREDRLKTQDEVDTIMTKVFRADGTIDKAEFEKAVEVTDRRVIYQSIVEADTTVSGTDAPKLRTAMSDAVTLIEKVEADAPGLDAVFGAKAAEAKTIYEKARASIAEVSKDKATMATRVSTDYNLDDPEMLLGGWASFGARHMHLLADIARVTDPGETKATIIHEASHLADSSVDDRGYYGTPGFEAMSETDKLGNAAHYEELPRRVMNKSKYVGMTFTPGVAQEGGQLTREDRVRRDASEYLRQAWDTAVSIHLLIRGVRRKKLSGDDEPFTNNKVVLLEISRLMDLTIHEQLPTHAEVTQLDVTLSESIARAVKLLTRTIGVVPFPNPPGTPSALELRDRIVKKAVLLYGNLLKDETRDKTLLDWLLAHYRTVPNV